MIWCIFNLILFLWFHCFFVLAKILWGLQTNIISRGIAKLSWFINSQNCWFHSKYNSPLFIVDQAGVHFLKILLNYCTWRLTFWLLFLVKKLGAKHIFWCSTSSPEKAVKKLGARPNSWEQLLRNWPHLSWSQWLIIFKEQVGHLTKYVFGHIKSVIWYCLKNLS